jgi:hypothetical protein
MTGTRTAGTRVLLLGLVVAAIAVGTAAAVISTVGLRVQARLTPVAGGSAAGRFDGLLSRSGEGTPPPAVPRAGAHWHLAWSMGLPALRGPAAATLQTGAGIHVLCTHCGRSARGTLVLTNGQAMRIADSDAVVVVRAARLRGVVRVVPAVLGSPRPSLVSRP